MNLCQPRFHWSPPPTSCCSPSDSLKATRSSEDTSRLFWKSVSHLTKYLYVCMCDPETLSSFLYTECMNMIALPASPGDAGVMTSPFYPSLLPRQCSCTWMFQVLHPIKSFFNVYQYYPRHPNGCFQLGVYVSDAQRSSWCGSRVSELHAKTKRLSKLWTRLVESQWEYVSDISVNYF